MENKGKSGTGLRTSRLPRICYEPIAIVSPYLLAPLRQCLVGCTVCGSAVVHRVNACATCTCLQGCRCAVRERERERERICVWPYVTTPAARPDIDSILLVHTVMLGWHWYSLTAKSRFAGGCLRKNRRQRDFHPSVTCRSDARMLVTSTR